MPLISSAERAPYVRQGHRSGHAPEDRHPRYRLDDSTVTATPDPREPPTWHVWVRHEAPLSIPCPKAIGRYPPLIVMAVIVRSTWVPSPSVVGTVRTEVEKECIWLERSP